MNKKKLLITLGSAASIIVMVLGLLMIFSKPTLEATLPHATINPHAKGLKPSYNTSAVKPITSASMAQAYFQSRNLRPEGEIAIPSSGINLNIYEGINNAHLMLGAGEQMPRAVVKNGGPGNYILASHRAMNGWLFSNLNQSRVGSYIYTTDAVNVYQYKIDDVEEVSVNDSKVLEQPQQPAKPIAPDKPVIVDNIDNKFASIRQGVDKNVDLHSDDERSNEVQKQTDDYLKSLSSQDKATYDKYQTALASYNKDLKYYNDNVVSKITLYTCPIYRSDMYRIVCTGNLEKTTKITSMQDDVVKPFTTTNKNLMPSYLSGYY